MVFLKIGAEEIGNIIFALFGDKISNSQKKNLMTYNLIIKEVFESKMVMAITKYLEKDEKLHEEAFSNAIQAWSEEDFVKISTPQRHLYLSLFLILSIEKLNEKFLQTETIHFLRGVQCRLESPLNNVRRLGMLIAEKFSFKVDSKVTKNPLKFDENDDYHDILEMVGLVKGNILGFLNYFKILLFFLNFYIEEKPQIPPEKKNEENVVFGFDVPSSSSPSPTPSSNKEKTSKKKKRRFKKLKENYSEDEGEDEEENPDQLFFAPKTDKNKKNEDNGKKSEEEDEDEDNSFDLEFSEEKEEEKEGDLKAFSISDDQSDLDRVKLPIYLKDCYVGLSSGPEEVDKLEGAIR